MTFLFDPKVLAERLRKAGEEEVEDFPLVGRPASARENLDWLPSEALQRKLMALWEARKKAGHVETLRELHDRLLALAVEKLVEPASPNHP